MNRPANHARNALNLAALPVFCIAGLVFVTTSYGQLDRDAQAMQDFSNKIHLYLKIHHQAEVTVPHIKPTASAKKIIDRKHALAAQINKERGNIKEGNVFTPEVAAYFERLIHSAYRQNAPGIEATLLCLSPVREDRLKPNDIYPEDAELTAMPSTILLHVPELPSELEYRIVNKDLIIRDREANLIVDIFRGAITPPPGRKLCDD